MFIILKKSIYYYFENYLKYLIQQQPLLWKSSNKVKQSFIANIIAAYLISYSNQNYQLLLSLSYLFILILTLLITVIILRPNLIVNQVGLIPFFFLPLAFYTSKYQYYSLQILSLTLSIVFALLVLLCMYFNFTIQYYPQLTPFMSLKKIVLIYVYYILCALDFEYQDVFLALLFLVKIIINLIQPSYIDKELNQLYMFQLEFICLIFLQDYIPVLFVIPLSLRLLMELNKFEMVKIRLITIYQEYKDLKQFDNNLKARLSTLKLILNLGQLDEQMLSQFYIKLWDVYQKFNGEYNKNSADNIFYEEDINSTKQYQNIFKQLAFDIIEFQLNNENQKSVNGGGSQQYVLFLFSEKQNLPQALLNQLRIKEQIKKNKIRLDLNYQFNNYCLKTKIYQILQTVQLSDKTKFVLFWKQDSLSLLIQQDLWILLHYKEILNKILQQKDNQKDKLQIIFQLIQSIIQQLELNLKELGELTEYQDSQYFLYGSILYLQLYPNPKKKSIFTKYQKFQRASSLEQRIQNNQCAIATVSFVDVCEIKKYTSSFVEIFKINPELKIKMLINEFQPIPVQSVHHQIMRNFLERGYQIISDNKIFPVIDKNNFAIKSIINVSINSSDFNDLLIDGFFEIQEETIIVLDQVGNIMNMAESFYRLVSKNEKIKYLSSFNEYNRSFSLQEEGVYLNICMYFPGLGDLFFYDNNTELLQKKEIELNTFMVLYDHKKFEQRLRNKNYLNFRKKINDLIQLMGFNVDRNNKTNIKQKFWQEWQWMFTQVLNYQCVQVKEFNNILLKVIQNSNQNQYIRISQWELIILYFGIELYEKDRGQRSSEKIIQLNKTMVYSEQTKTNFFVIVHKKVVFSIAIILIRSGCLENYSFSSQEEENYKEDYIDEEEKSLFHQIENLNIKNTKDGKLKASPENSYYQYFNNQKKVTKDSSIDFVESFFSENHAIYYESDQSDSSKENQRFQGEINNKMEEILPNFKNNNSIEKNTNNNNEQVKKQNWSLRESIIMLCIAIMFQLIIIANSCYNLVLVNRMNELQIIVKNSHGIGQFQILINQLSFYSALQILLEERNDTTVIFAGLQQIQDVKIFYYIISLFQEYLNSFKENIQIFELQKNTHTIRDEFQKHQIIVNPIKNQLIIDYVSKTFYQVIFVDSMYISKGLFDLEKQQKEIQNRYIYFVFKNQDQILIHLEQIHDELEQQKINILEQHNFLSLLVFIISEILILIFSIGLIRTQRIFHQKTRFLLGCFFKFSNEDLQEEIEEFQQLRKMLETKNNNLKNNHIQVLLLEYKLQSSRQKLNPYNKMRYSLILTVALMILFLPIFYIPNIIFNSAQTQEMDVLFQSYNSFRHFKNYIHISYSDLLMQNLEQTFSNTSFRLNQEYIQHIQQESQILFEGDIMQNLKYQNYFTKNICDFQSKLTNQLLIKQCPSILNGVLNKGIIQYSTYIKNILNEVQDLYKFHPISIEDDSIMGQIFTSFMLADPIIEDFFYIFTKEYQKIQADLESSNILLNIFQLSLSLTLTIILFFVVIRLKKISTSIAKGLNLFPERMKNRNKYIKTFLQGSLQKYN